MTVNNKFGEREELKQVNPRRGYDTLRVFIDPDGSQAGQLREMKKKAISWAYKIQSGHIPAKEACQCIPSTTKKTGVPPTGTNPLKKGMWRDN